MKGAWSEVRGCVCEGGVVGGVLHAHGSFKVKMEKLQFL